jgi:hypothetical protein
VHIWYSFRSTVVLGDREGNLYRSRGHPMSFVANKIKETEKEEHVALPVVRNMAPLVAQV